MYPSISSGYFWDAKIKERLDNPKFLESYGQKYYSQNDEDGIIAEIFNRIGTTDKRFIEFGVQDGLESNSHLLLHKGWTGLWIEGSKKYFKRIQKNFETVINKNQLKAHNGFITCDNINSIFETHNFCGEIDLLSIDIDGNDYHIFEKITGGGVISPRVVVIEYNAKFPPDCEWIIQYNPYYQWDGSDNHSASLRSLELLAYLKGYQLVGTNYCGVNAFFVRKDLTKDLFPLPATAENLYNPFRYGNIIYTNGYFAKKCLIN